MLDYKYQLQTFSLLGLGSRELYYGKFPMEQELAVACNPTIATLQYAKLVTLVTSTKILRPVDLVSLLEIASK